MESRELKSKELSYIFWALFLLGFGGIHRIYNGKIGSGLLWFFTWGLFGIGQVVDLFLIPEMVDDYNQKYMRQGISPYGINPGQVTVSQIVEPPRYQDPKEKAKQLKVKLVQAAQAHGGKLSVTQAVLETEADFEEVEAALQSMAKAGYIGIDNSPTTGAVVYVFHEL